MLKYTLSILFSLFVLSGAPASAGGVGTFGSAAIAKIEQTSLFIPVAAKSALKTKKKIVIRKSATRSKIRTKSRIRRPVTTTRSKIRTKTRIRRAPVKTRVKKIVRKKAKARTVRAKRAAPANTPGTTKLPERRGFSGSPERVRGLGDQNRMLIKEEGVARDFGERKDRGQQNIPQRPGDRRVAPGTTLGGFGGPGAAGSAPTPPMPVGEPSPTPPKPDDDRAGGSGGSASASDDPEEEGGQPVVPGNPETGLGNSGSSAGTGALNLDAAGRPGSGGKSGGFRQSPTTQPGAGQGQGAGSEPGDFRKAPQKRKNPFGRAIQRPRAGPGGSINPTSQPPAGEDGTGVIRGRRTLTPLEKRMQHTDPAGGSGGAMAQ